jgi:hypothetical protein
MKLRKINRGIGGELYALHTYKYLRMETEFINLSRKSKYAFIDKKFSLVKYLRVTIKMTNV